jgi:hypothetical protein
LVTPGHQVEIAVAVVGDAGHVVTI